VALDVDCSSWSDGAIARAVGQGGGDAGRAEAELCRRFLPRARAYGLRHLRDPHAADDLAQRILLLTIEKLRRREVRDPDAVTSFVFGIARMLVHDIRRTRRPELPVADDESGLPIVTAADADPLAGRLLARCLQALAERERSIVVLTYFREASTDEIASSLGLAEGHVRVVRHRAMKNLRQCMGPAVTAGGPQR